MSKDIHLEIWRDSAGARLLSSATELNLSPEALRHLCKTVAMVAYSSFAEAIADLENEALQDPPRYRPQQMDSYSNHYFEVSDE